MQPLPASKSPMAVHCEGNCRFVELLGGKLDFESELSRRGSRREDFTLQVARVPRARSRTWSEQDHLVTVVNAVTQAQRLRRSGPRGEWVPGGAADLARGVFGPPVLRRA